VAPSIDHRCRAASVLASEQIRLLEESPAALRGIGVIHGAAFAKLFAGEATEAYRLAQWSIDMVGGDPVKGRTASLGSSLADSLLWRGLAGCSLGGQNWRNDIRSGIAMQRSVDANAVALLSLISLAYCFGMLSGALLADDDAVRDTAEAVRIAEERGDDVALEHARLAHGLVLSRRATAAEREAALGLLRHGRDAIAVAATMADIRIAELTAEAGEVQGAIESARSIVDRLFENGEMFLRGAATAALVESLLCSGSTTTGNPRPALPPDEGGRAYRDGHREVPRGEPCGAVPLSVHRQRGLIPQKARSVADIVDAISGRHAGNDDCRRAQEA
jgi:adenylate cyclase